MRILITGGAGFVGCHIAEAWQNKAEIVVLDNLRSGYRENLQDLRVQFIQGDINNLQLVDELCRGVDIIYHQAALVSVVESIADPRTTEEINVIGWLNLLENARKHRVRRLVFASSAAVYGDNCCAKQVEEAKLDPLSPYAASKVAGENYLSIYQQLHGISGVSLRNFNIFGPKQDLSSAYASVIPVFINKALANEDLVIYGDGIQTRDFIYVKDVAAANLCFGSNQLAGVYNIASGASVSINDLAQTIIKLTGSASQISYAQARSGEVRNSLADTSKASRDGFKVNWNLENALQETIAYYQMRKEKYREAN